MSDSQNNRAAQRAALISENTKLTVSVVTLLIAFTAWITVMFFQVQASARDIQEIKSKQDVIVAIQLDVAIIKEQVSGISKKLEHAEEFYDQSSSGNRPVRRGN